MPRHQTRFVKPAEETLKTIARVGSAPSVGQSDSRGIRLMIWTNYKSDRDAKGFVSRFLTVETVDLAGISRPKL